MTRRDYEVTFYLGRRLPSCEHTYRATATGPLEVLGWMLIAHPAALMPFRISEADGQGDGHRPFTVDRVPPVIAEALNVREPGCDCQHPWGNVQLISNSCPIHGLAVEGES